MRKLLYGLIGAVVVAVAAALIVPSFIDWNSYKAQLAEQVRSATGRELVINGDLDLSVLPSPRLSAEDVRLANVAGASAPEMARLKALRVSVRFAPLISGRLEIESLALIDPVIELERLADGRVNWELGKPDKDGRAAVPRGRAGDRAPASPAIAPDGGADAFSLDSLRIVNGTAIYRDIASKTVERVDKLDMEISARSLSGPFSLEGRLTARGVALAVTASVGDLARQTGAPVKMTLGVPAAGAEAEVSGTLSGGMAAPRVKGKLRATGRSLAALLAALSGGQTMDALAQPFSLDAQVDVSLENLAVDGIALRLGETHANGGINAVFDDRVQVDVALRLGRLDLDALLAAAAAGAASPDRPRPDQAKSLAKPSPPTAQSKDGGEGFTLPAGVGGSLDLAIEAATLRGGQVRGLKLAASLNEGELTLNQLSARLPGGAEVSLFGFLTAPGGKPAFDGTIDVRADNLRAVLDWLRVDVAAVPADRLRKFVFTAKLRGDPSQIQVAGIKVQLDASRIRGGVTYALARARPAFGARFSIDQFNIDAYSPPGKAATKSRPAADPSTQPRAPPGARRGTGDGGASPLAALDDFDANLSLQIGTLNYRRTPIQGVVFDGTLLKGRLNLRRLSVKSLSGTAATVKGRLSGLAGVPVFNGTFSANSKNITGLTRVLGIRTAVPPKRFGRMRLRGRADGGGDRVTLDTTLELDGAKAVLEGTVAGMRKAPKFDLTLSASHPALARLAALLGTNLGPDSGRFGAFGFTGKAKGDMAAVDLDIRLKVAGADLAFDGKLTNPATTPAIDGKLDARHPSYVRLMRMLDAGFKAPRGKIGPVKVAARIKGNEKTVRITELDGSVGPVRLGGEGALDLTAAKPSLTATLTAGEIDLNRLLPPDAAQRSGAAGAPRGAGAIVGAPAAAARRAVARTPGRRFSRAPLDLSALDVMNADIKLGAKALMWQSFRVDDPQIAATLQDKVLTVSRLAGRMFDGGFDMTGRIGGAATPIVESTIRVTRASIGKALFQAANFDIAKGVLDFEMRIKGRGRSEFAMVSSLAGDGRMAVRGGEVKGFDLRAVSNRLKRLDRATDLLGLLGASMAGGATRFSAVDGSFKIQKGVLRTDDLKLTADAGSGRAVGFVDLPAWNMDVRAEFRLTEHPKAPPFNMRVVGPPDRPRRLFKMDRLQAYLLQRGMGSILQKVLPGVIRRPPPQQAPQTSQPQPVQPQPTPQPPQPVRPKDILRGLLEGLQRR